MPFPVMLMSRCLYSSPTACLYVLLLTPNCSFISSASLLSPKRQRPPCVRRYSRSVWAKSTACSCPPFCNFTSILPSCRTLEIYPLTRSPVWILRKICVSYSSPAYALSIITLNPRSVFCHSSSYSDGYVTYDPGCCAYSCSMTAKYCSNVFDMWGTSTSIYFVTAELAEKGGELVLTRININ